MTTNTNVMTGTPVVADINVQSCAPATGRQGQAQWQLTAEVPWSKYPERFWVDAGDGVQPITPGVHHCAFSIGDQKANTTGQAPFHYRFRIDLVDYVGGAYPDIMSLNFAGNSVPQNSPGTGGAVSAPTYAPEAGLAPGLGVSRDESIVRQSSIKAVMDAKVAAFNNATNLLTSGHLIPDEPDERVHETIAYTAGVLLSSIMADVPMWVEYVVGIVNRQIQEPEETNEPDPDA